MLNTRLTSILIATTVISGCVGEVAVPTAVGGSWFNHDRRTAGAIIDDQAITVRANLAIAKDKKIWQESHISTLSYNNTLLLVGQTKSSANKRQIENLVKPLGGIGDIYNQITVGEPIPMKKRANDTWITTQVKTRIISNRNVGINRVKVITEDCVVYLMGKLTADEQEMAVDIARNVEGVRQVVTLIEPVDRLEQ